MATMSPVLAAGSPLMAKYSVPASYVKYPGPEAFRASCSPESHSPRLPSSTMAPECWYADWSKVPVPVVGVKLTVADWATQVVQLTVWSALKSAAGTVTSAPTAPQVTLPLTAPAGVQDSAAVPSV